VHKAWASGAEMIKLFPASVFGPSYIRSLKGPFNSIKFMAVGGVDEGNISGFFECGADAVAFGAGIFRPEWLRNNRYDLIESKLVSLIRAYQANIA
jgi:2-dehydro-3-deoxyphosphogluconate aldolase/(4S)-4-hydroxy-2-oxoglutarate aldolase